MGGDFKAIPTNLITGFLGSGKTTAILELLKNKPKGSCWAVLVNEFGDVGIDGALLAENHIGDRVFIKEVPGGCMCCAAGLPLQMALNLLIKQANPDRILIEPTGVGHPLKVIATLTGEFYARVLDLRATICLVEAKRLNDPRYLNNETFIDQVNIADVLLASKCDQTSEADKQRFMQLAEQLNASYKKDCNQSEIHTDCIEFGQFSLDLLDLPRNPHRRAAFPEAHPSRSTVEPAHASTHQDDTGILQAQTADNPEPTACDWRRFENNGQGYYGCGWIFRPEIIFNEHCLMQWANNPVFSRVKGLFHTETGWIVINRMDTQISCEPCSYTTDSRVELIETDAQDWNQVEQDLIQCIARYPS